MLKLYSLVITQEPSQTLTSHRRELKLSNMYSLQAILGPGD